jgi:pimeloyl-ACP methyl ester carboxylesterase
MKILLLPGLGSSPELFEPLIEAAPPRFESSVVSYPEDPDFSYPDYAEYVLDQCSPRTSFVLLGESFSGPVAILAAARKPAGLAGVILCNSFVVRPAWRSWRHLPWERLMTIPVTRTTAGLFIAGFADAHRFLAPIRRAHRGIGPEVLASRLRLTLEVDVRHEVGALDKPLLYLRGSQDRLVSSRSWKQVVRNQPSTRVVQIAGPHLVLQVAPEACWRAISEFADGLETI